MVFAKIYFVVLVRLHIEYTVTNTFTNTFTNTLRTTSLTPLQTSRGAPMRRGARRTTVLAKIFVKVSINCL